MGGGGGGRAFITFQHKLILHRNFGTLSKILLRMKVPKNGIHIDFCHGKPFYYIIIKISIILHFWRTISEKLHYIQLLC